MTASLLLLVLALLGTPLFVVIGGGALLGFHAAGIDLTAIPIEIYRLVDTPVLVAIPLFTLTGYLLSESRASQRLVQLTDALLGWLPGGLAIVAFVACAAFTALTGASGITVIALGGLLYPALVQAGYRERFGLGLITSSGSLGLLFPPSIGLILYGVIAQQMDAGRAATVNNLFLAGLLPGALMLVALAAYGAWSGRHIRTAAGFDVRRALGALRAAVWELPLPVIVLGGIYGGWFALSEAAAVSLLYTLAVEVFIYREVAVRDLPRIVRQSMLVVGGVLIILAVSLASTNYLIDAEVPARLFHFIRSHIDSALVFLLLLNAFLLVLGMTLDLFSALVLMVPLILPVAAGYGIDPVHLGIIFLANMQIGYFTPPVGLNLFLASYRFGRPLTELFHATLPFLAILLATVLVITYWPALSLALLPGR